MSNEFDADDIENTISDSPVTIARTKNGTVLINPKSIYRMASMGWTAKEIARVLCIDDNTLYKHFGHELQTGKATIGPRLKANLLRQALAYDKPTPALLIFALKNWAGMTDEGFRDADTDEETVEFTVKVPKKDIVAAQKGPVDGEAD